MAALPDLESAEQAYERGWDDALKNMAATLDKRALDYAGSPLSATGALRDMADAARQSTFAAIRGD